MRKLAHGLRAGFTLLEVMVSTAIMVVIVLTVVTIAADTMRVYDRAVADLSTQSEARGVLDAMENDFSTAVLRADGRCWMEIVIPGGNGAPAGSPAAVGNVHRVDSGINCGHQCCKLTTGCVVGVQVHRNIESLSQRCNKFFCRSRTQQSGHVFDCDDVRSGGNHFLGKR